VVVCLKFALPNASERNIFEHSIEVTLNQFQLAYSRRIIGAFFTFWSWIRLMQYVGSSKKLGPLIEAIKQMLFGDIIVFIMLALIVITGFSIITMQITGSNMLEYKEIGISLYTLFQVIFGNTDFPDFGSGGPSFGQAMGSVMVGIYAVTMSILLVNLLIAMMGNTYNTVKNDALGHWALSFTHTVIYYERPVWIPPFNLIQEAMALVIFIFDKISFGHFTKFTTLETVEISAILGSDMARFTATTNNKTEKESFSKGDHVKISEEVIWQIVSSGNIDNSIADISSKKA